MFNVKQPLAMLLATHGQFFEQQREVFGKVLKAITVISFRYNVICNLQPQDQERLYNDVARGVSAGELSDGQLIVEALEDIYPDDNSFKAAFARKEFRTTNSRNKKVVKYILFEIEHHRSGNSLDPESITYNLEHILPEHPGEDWSDIDETKQERLIYRIGNLTILESKINRGIGNQGFALKREAYAESSLQISQAIAEHYDSWDEQKIDSRQKQLANVAAGIWKV
jgi:hypothetical protein